MPLNWAFVVHAEVIKRLEAQRRNKVNDLAYLAWDEDSASGSGGDAVKDVTKIKPSRYIDQKINTSTGKKKIALHKSELKLLFEYLGIDEKNGRITKEILCEKLRPLFGSKSDNDMSLTDDDIECMMQGKDVLSFEDLEENLLDNEFDINEVTTGNPIESAFYSIFDLNKTGYVDGRRLMEIFELMGFEMITKKDVKDVMKKCDVDKDGRLSLKDVCQLIFKYDLNHKCGMTDKEIASLGFGHLNL